MENLLLPFNYAFNKGKDDLPETEYVDDFMGDYVEEEIEPPEETESEETEENTE